MMSQYRHFTVNMTEMKIVQMGVRLSVSEMEVFSRFVLIKRVGDKSLAVGAPCGNPREL